MYLFKLTNVSVQNNNYIFLELGWSVWRARHQHLSSTHFNLDSFTKVDKKTTKMIGGVLTDHHNNGYFPMMILARKALD